MFLEFNLGHFDNEGVVTPSSKNQVKKKNGDVLLTAKAFNGRIILSWLSECLLEARGIHPDHEVLLLSSSAMNLGTNRVGPWLVNDFFNNRTFQTGLPAFCFNIYNETLVD